MQCPLQLQPLASVCIRAALTAAWLRGRTRNGVERVAAAPEAAGTADAAAVAAAATAADAAGAARSFEAAAS